MAQAKTSGRAPRTVVEVPPGGTDLDAPPAPGARALRVLFDDRPATGCATGIGRYAATLGQLLTQGLPGIEAHLLTGPAWRGARQGPAEEELLLPLLLEREGVDVLHSPLFRVPAVLPERVKLVITIHDTIPLHRPELTSPAFRSLFAAEARAAVERADLVVCPSQHAREQLEQGLGVPPEKLHVLTEAAAAVFGPQPAEAVRRVCERHGLAPGRYLLAVGSLEPRKAPDLTLDALVALRSRLPDLVAAFAGPRAGFDLAHEADRRGVGAFTRELGLVPDADLACLYAGALAVVVPSRHEGFGLPIVEAFACGAPVVAADATSLPEVAGDAALLVPPEDPGALADAVERVAREDGLADALRRRGAARLEAWFSEARVRAGLQALYARLSPGQEAP